MADQSDVEKALVSLITGALYPNGVRVDPTQSAIGAACRVARGWPAQDNLDADLRANIVNVTVFPRPNMERNTTRFPMEWAENAIPATTYTIAASGQTITLGGAAPSPYVAQNFAAWVNGVAYVVQATAGQAPSDVAAALCQAIQADVPGASVSGTVITLPAGAVLGNVVVGSTGSASMEVGRQEKSFQIVFWCPTPDLRDAAVSCVDPVLRASYRIALADGSVATMKYQGSVTNDAPQKELLFRRDLFFAIEYPTTLTITAAQLVAGDLRLTDPFGNVIAVEQVSVPGALDLNLGADGALNTVV